MVFRVLLEAICSGVSHEFFADLKKSLLKNREQQKSRSKNTGNGKREG